MPSHVRRLAPRLVFFLATVAAASLLLPGAAAAQQPPRDGPLVDAAREIIAASRWAGLVTLGDGGTPRARTMDPFPPDSQFVIWMGTNRASRKVEDIRRVPRVLLYWQDPDGAGYVTLEGTARLVDDPAEKERRWKPEWEAFYPDRAATYLLIAVTPARLEVVNYRAGVVGDSVTWAVPAVDFAPR